MKKMCEDFEFVKEKDTGVFIKTIESNIVIKGFYIRVRSVFYDKVPLEKVLGNLAHQKMRKLDKNSKF